MASSTIGVRQPVTRLHPTDPGVRNYRTGLFKVIHFALDHFRGRFIIPRSEVAS
jgi:hypothetical protein